MRKRVRGSFAVALALVAAQLGCSGGDAGGDGDAFLESAQGTWVSCAAAGGAGDVQTIDTIAGNTSAVATLRFTSSDGTCTGHVAEYHPSSATFTLGASVQATLGGVTVTAREVNVTPGGGSALYTIAYVDVAAEPDALYQGDLGADPSRDGSSPAARPLVLATAGAPKGAPPPVLAFVEALQGTWISCSNDGGGAPDLKEALTIDGLAVAGESWTYPSTDATCAGAATPEAPFSANATVGPMVGATLGGVAVSGARETDVTPTSGAPFYSILYLDLASEPDVLYTGDETTDPARDATAPERRPNVLEQGKPRVKAGGAPGTDFAQLLQGTWAVCIGDPSGDGRLSYTFSGSAFTASLAVHPSTNGTCTGTPFVFSGGGTFTVGGTVTASLNGILVVAHQADFVAAGVQPFYTILYVDTGASPPVLFEGDDTADPSRDGAAPDRRPNVLFTIGYTKQP